MWDSTYRSQVHFCWWQAARAVSQQDQEWVYLLKNGLTSTRNDSWGAAIENYLKFQNETAISKVSRTMKLRKVVVIDGDSSHDWCALFAGKTLQDGSAIHVLQCSWIETGVSVDHDQGTHFVVNYCLCNNRIILRQKVRQLSYSLRVLFHRCSSQRERQ